jgi:hypothetical protein
VTGRISTYGADDFLSRGGTQPVPGSWTSHHRDPDSRGMVVGCTERRVTVLWRREPWFDSLQMQSQKIKASSRMLKARWVSEEAPDHVAFVGDWDELTKRMGCGLPTEFHGMSVEVRSTTPWCAEEAIEATT